jgi:hypothetical protein
MCWPCLTGAPHAAGGGYGAGATAALAALLVVTVRLFLIVDRCVLHLSIVAKLCSLERLAG